MTHDDDPTEPPREEPPTIASAAGPNDGTRDQLLSARATFTEALQLRGGEYGMPAMWERAMYLGAFLIQVQEAPHLLEDMVEGYVGVWYAAFGGRAYLVLDERRYKMLGQYAMTTMTCLYTVRTSDGVEHVVIAGGEGGDTWEALIHAAVPGAKILGVVRVDRLVGLRVFGLETDAWAEWVRDPSARYVGVVAAAVTPATPPATR